MGSLRGPSHKKRYNEEHLERAERSLKNRLIAPTIKQDLLVQLTAKEIGALRALEPDLK
jgi:hypothetical protein